MAVYSILQCLLNAAIERQRFCFSFAWLPINDSATGLAANPAQLQKKANSRLNLSVVIQRQDALAQA